MPEAAVNEHDRAQSGKYDVRLARQVRMIDTEPETAPVQETADEFFRFCVAATDAGHHTATCGAVYDIGH